MTRTIQTRDPPPPPPPPCGKLAASSQQTSRGREIDYLDLLKVIIVFLETKVPVAN